jgi:hypothetical protein
MRAARLLAELTEHEAISEAVGDLDLQPHRALPRGRGRREAENQALSALSRQAGMRPTELVGAIYSHRGREAVDHLFSVAAGSSQ